MGNRGRVARASAGVVGALGAAVVARLATAGVPGRGTALAALLTAGLVVHAWRMRRTDPPWTRAAAAAALGLWTMTLVIWLLPVRSASERCGTVLAPAQPWSARDSVCGWMTAHLFDATAPALALAAVFALAAALGTWLPVREHRPPRHVAAGRA